jgi:glycosyltransferase involved in cell wall biosynthesis
VLHLGSNDPRDDTPTAIAAARAAGVPLVIAGGWSGAAPEGVELAGRVTDERLVELYQGARALLDTSLYEGFGYQALEAMACGTPVVASRATSLPELVGEAGLLCPPGDADAFAAALGRVLTDEVLRLRLRERGLERAHEFTWERTAQGLDDALAEALA